MIKRTIAFRVLHRRQAAHIEEGLRQADAGKFANPSAVSSAFARWRKPTGSRRSNHGARRWPEAL
jgi:predicted transcriptional regulator